MGRWQDKYVIGLTGNIAVGKSLVRRMLEHLGAYTLDADGLAHQVMAPNAPAYKPVIEMFGNFIVKEDGQIDRNRLGAVAFSNREALEALESITHPIIRSAIDTLISRARHSVVVVEAIKMIETGLADQMDAVWVVDAKPEMQLQRLMTKRGFSKEDAQKRIAVQNPQADKIKRADVVIDNNGKPEQVWAQVQQAWNKIEQGRADSEAIEAVRHIEVQPGQADGDGAAISSLNIKRPRPSEFDKIAQLISSTTGKSVSSHDIMASFGEKTYLLAEANNAAVGVVAFLVENLVTRVDDFIVGNQAPMSTVGRALIEAMESASDELQSEVAFVFLPSNAQDQINVFSGLDYEQIKPEEIRIPAWREAVTESLPENAIVLTKRLREKLVLKPI